MLSPCAIPMLPSYVAFYLNTDEEKNRKLSSAIIFGLITVAGFLTIFLGKSGKEQELIFIPQKVADRLKEYVRVQKIAPTQLIFPICYGAARAMVGKAGKLVGIRLRPHDLRRHAATFASRSNVPLEIISKIILRHSSLQTTEIYLGKVSDSEAIRWIENLYS